jgi:hypothetical protein
MVTPESQAKLKELAQQARRKSAVSSGSAGETTGNPNPSPGPASPGPKTKSKAKKPA